MTHVRGLTLTLAAAAGLVASGCWDIGSSGGLAFGLQGHVLLEVASQPTDGVPAAVPVAVWLAPESHPSLTPLAGAVVRLWAGNVTLAETTTDAAGRWALPVRSDPSAEITVLAPAGLFDTLAAAPVVPREPVALTGKPHQLWPAEARRVSRDEVLGGMSLIIEGIGP